MDRFIRTHPAIIAGATMAAVVGVTVSKLRASGDFSLALSYAIPLALCAYGVGFVAGLLMALAVSILWVLDAAASGMTASDAAYSLMARLITDIGIVGVAALARAAAGARERHLAGHAQIERLRADLVSAFSHDLRSPLNAIVGYAEILREELPNAASHDTAEALDGILTNARRLDDLIRDMIGTGHGDVASPVEISVFEPQALVDELRAEFAHASRGKPIAVLWSIDPQTPAFQTDRVKLTSVVRNLVSNALKFTRAGTVRIRIAYRHDTDAHFVDVEDSGPGISAEALPHIFDRFYRGSGSPSHDGFGLGLFIVKRLTEIIAGSVEVSSELRRGTRVSVTVPRLPAQSLPQELGSEPAHKLPEKPS